MYCAGVSLGQAFGFECIMTFTLVRGRVSLSLFYMSMPEWDCISRKLCVCRYLLSMQSQSVNPTLVTSAPLL